MTTGKDHQKDTGKIAENKLESWLKWLLGVQWLKTLGPVLTDYTTLMMKFMVAGHLVELQGEHEQALESISSS